MPEPALDPVLFFLFLLEPGVTALLDLPAQQPGRQPNREGLQIHVVHPRPALRVRREVGRQPPEPVPIGLQMTPHVLGPGRQHRRAVVCQILGVGVARGSENGHEDLDLADISGLPVDDADAAADVIDEHPLPGLVVLPHPDQANPAHSRYSLHYRLY